jgi:DNA polymerase family B
MIPRRPHKLKRNKGTEGPSNFLFFDCETLPYASPNRSGQLRHRLRLGVAIACRLDHGRVTHRVIGRFTSQAGFSALLTSRLRAKTPLWVFAHNLAFDFRLVGGFSLIQRNDPDKWRVILADPPTIIQGRIGGCTVRFVDTMNYVRTSLASIGETERLPKGTMPSFTASDEDWFAYCQRDVEIIESYVIRLRNYLQDNDCGTFGKTAAMCGMNLYRHRLMGEQIILHADNQATELERDAYYGGQLECFRLGPLAGPIWHLDVNSLYPSIMATERFPTSLIGVYENVSLDWLKCRLPEYGAAADCLVVSSERTYPKRFDYHTHYVKGVFRTSLAGAELCNAIARGSVVYLGRVSLYHLGDTFSEFVRWLWAEKQRARACGDSAWELTIKMLLNSLSGKWAQSSPRYVARPDVKPPVTWGEFYRRDLLEERIKEFRAIAGIAQELVRHDEGWQSFPAISAFITSAARERMRQLREIVGAGGVHYQDTDSLMVDDDGLDNLLVAGEISATELGKLKVVKRAETGHIFGPKDYLLDGVNVRGSVAKSARQIGPDAWEQWDFQNAEMMLRFNALPETIQTREVRNLRPHYRKGRVLASGATQPFEVYSF